MSRRTGWAKHSDQRAGAPQLFTRTSEGRSTPLLPTEMPGWSEGAAGPPGGALPAVPSSSCLQWTPRRQVACGTENIQCTWNKLLPRTFGDASGTCKSVTGRRSLLPFLPNRFTGLLLRDASLAPVHYHKPMISTRKSLIVHCFWTTFLIPVSFCPLTAPTGLSHNPWGFHRLTPGTRPPAHDRHW